MAAAITKCYRFLSLLEARILQMIRVPPHGYTPALAVVDHRAMHEPVEPTGKSVLESILGDGFFYAVPKSRRTREKRKTRMFGIKGHFEDALPKKNIIACLECGHWHEAHTICGNCYEKVREETKLMRENTNHDDYYYDAPRSEVVYLYEGEGKDKPLFGGKYIVEMPKPRPQWWSNNLLVKGRKS